MTRCRQLPRPFHFDWLSQKCFDGACPLGPWIVPASDIFDTAEQIAMLSSRVTLQPGDLVLTGTPAGVGMGRKRFLQPVERVRLWTERIANSATGSLE